MTAHHNEYRVTKRGAECFRSTCRDDAVRKYDELSGKRPNVYKMQYRTCQVDKHGCLLTDGSGKPLWSCSN